jgi:L-rhamnose mutarotase
MERYAWRATVKEGMLDEYIKRHDEIWVEMKDMLHEAGIRNYSIWNVGNDLFGYYECDSIAKASLVQANSPINAKWDEYMQDVMVMTKDPVTGAQPLLTQVFYFD